MILLSRQGKVVSITHTISFTAHVLTSQRLAKWFTTLSPKEKAKIIKDVSQLVLARRTRMCNFLEYKGIPPHAVCGHPRSRLARPLLLKPPTLYCHVTSYS